METAIAALIIITLILFGLLTISQSALAAQDGVLESWREMEQRLEERARTDLSSVSGQTSALGDNIDITLRNDGSTKLADFEQWDVILQYTGSGLLTQWYPYGPGIDHWTYLIVDDVFDPGILNPGEEIMVQIWVSPPVAAGTTNLATIAAPNGISASTVFTH
jgi:hypothetical protein